MQPSKSNLSTLWQMMLGNRRRYLAALLFMFLGITLIYVTPLITRAAIDGIVDLHPTADISQAARLLMNCKNRWSPAIALTLAGALVVLLTSASALCTNLQGRLSGVASETIARRLRNRLANHLQHIPMTWFDTVQTGDIVQRCTSDVDTVRLFYREQVIDISRTAFRIAAGFPVLLWLDWKMALAATALMPIIIAFAVIFFSRVRNSFKKTEEAEGIMTAALQENLTGVRVVRAFARQAFEIDRFTDKNRNYRDASWRMTKIMATYWSSSDFMCFTQFTAIVVIGAVRAAHGTMTLGTLIAFISFAQMFIWPVRDVGRVLTELGKTLVALTRIREVLDIPEESAPPTTLQAPARIRGDIQLSHVSFKFGEKYVLRDLSLRIPAGSTLGILGPSGSGKSTLVHLLLRLYDHQEGTIALDGLDLQSLDRKFVRSQFGVVLQEPFLYSKTLRDNIKLGRHTAEDDEMFLATRAAAIHESIESFDKKYDTLIGERGVTLSGGQRQRTAIARALLKDAPVLILDDALSAVDTSTEVAILDQVRRRTGRHTIILIAHRLSTLMHADQIAVLDKGHIVQLGSHDQLVNEPGLYQQLWNIQGALAEELAETDREPSPTGAPALAGASALEEPA